MTLQYIILIIILLAGMVWSTRSGTLTLPGALTGGLIGLLVFAGAGFTGLFMMTAFFLMGTLATSWKRGIKEKLGVAEENKNGRTAGQVVANAGVAGIAGVAVLLIPGQTMLMRFLMASAFAAAAADTLASELGNVYGSRFYNILTLKKDSRGLDGVISLEGTISGVAGSIVIALIYSCGFGWNANFLFIVLAGTFGNLADSVLGATLERKRYLNNDAVNFLNTLLAACFAWIMHVLFV